MSTPASVSPLPDAPPRGGLRHSVMFGVALLFLAQFSLILPHADSGESFRETLLESELFTPMLFGLWMLIGAESLLGMGLASDDWRARLRRLLLVLALPPLRMTLSTSTTAAWLWVPLRGWRPVGPDTTRILERRFALPMILLTLLVVPVVLAEFGFGDTLDSRPPLALAVHLATCLIWLGFTIEFLWMISATSDKLQYTLRHWVNLTIILLPALALLRFLRVFQFARVFRAGKLLRAYRLRGLTMRIWRTVLLFNLVERLLQRNPVRYRASLEKKIAQAEEELNSLRSKLRALDSAAD